MKITSENRPAVLAALYNASKPQGMGLLHYTPETMTLEEASVLLTSPKGQYFDYLKGRVMKVNLGDDELDARLYDRDNGEGAATNTLLRAGLLN